MSFETFLVLDAFEADVTVETEVLDQPSAPRICPEYSYTATIRPSLHLAEILYHLVLSVPRQAGYHSAEVDH